MYRLTPPRVFVLDRVAQDPRCVARMERLLGGLGNQPELVWITDDNLPDQLAAIRDSWPPPAGSGLEPSHSRSLIFTTMDLSARRPDLRPLVQRCPPGTGLRDLQKVYGHYALAIDQHPHQRDTNDNMVCWPTYNFGTQMGCPHGCQYCGEGRTGSSVSIGLNLEDYVERIVGPVIEANPWNRVFRMILNGSDLMTFEPEYGLFDLFTRKLAEYEGRYGHFHTITSNVDWLADLPHRDRLVGVWSTTCEAAARDLEPGSGAAIDRIDAAARVQAMGIPVRYKFKPVLPVRNWLQEYAWIIEQACRRTQPESIGFALYMWNSFDAMSRALPLDLLDPDVVEAARGAQDRMRGSKAGPFPHETRRAIYQALIAEVRRWSQDIKLYVCTETREMWDDLTAELGQEPRWYVCGCGSVAVPGGSLAISPGFRNSTYHPTPV